MCLQNVCRWCNSRAEIESTSQTLLWARIIWHLVTADSDSGSLNSGVGPRTPFLSTSPVMLLLLEPQRSSRVLDYISQFCNFT